MLYLCFVSPTAADDTTVLISVALYSKISKPAFTPASMAAPRAWPSTSAELRITSDEDLSQWPWPADDALRNKFADSLIDSLRAWGPRSPRGKRNRFRSRRQIRSGTLLPDDTGASNPRPRIDTEHAIILHGGVIVVRPHSEEPIPENLRLRKHHAHHRAPPGHRSASTP